LFNSSNSAEQNSCNNPPFTVHVFWSFYLRLQLIWSHELNVH